VIAASQGNPLFLEEMAALARDRGTVEVPPTIQALLAARLERLPGPEREVLERGAVEGEVFHRLAVEALADDRLAPEVDLHLAGLVRKELIRPHPPTLDGDQAYRFRHLLIRDAAYDALAKATRATLHQRFATRLEQDAPDLIEFDEIAGWHLEQTLRYHQELGRDAAPELSRRAAGHLYAAGWQAVARQDLAAARSLLERALPLVKPQDSLYAQIAVALAETLVTLGDFDAAEEPLRIAESDPAVAPNATLLRLECIISTRPEEFSRAAETLLPAAIEELERRGDMRGLARAHMVAGWPHWTACRADATAAEVRMAVHYARAAGDDGLHDILLGSSFGPLLDGSTPAIEISGELDAIEAQKPGPFMTASLDLARGNLAMLAGRFDEGRVLLQRSREQLEALGQRMLRMRVTQVLADLERAAGNPAAARDLLLEADAVLVASGERGYRSTNQADLAGVYEQLGDRDAAVTALQLAETLGAEDDVMNLVISHSVRARLALGDGDYAAAERWARGAVEHAARTDFILRQATTKLELARVLTAVGKPDEAAAEAQDAVDLFEAKGDQPNAAKARGLRDQLKSQ
jgi:hypothetical protein